MTTKKKAKCVFGLAFGRAKSNSRGVELILDWF
jgi:hypothetical protein